MECHLQGQGAPVGLTSKQSMGTGTHERDWTLYYWNPEGEQQLIAPQLCHHMLEFTLMNQG